MVDRGGPHRREVIAALAVGGGGFLAGCIGGDDGGGDGDDSTAVTFTHIQTFRDPAAQLESMVEENREISLILQAGPAESAATRNFLINKFRSESSEFDAGMMDVVWPAEFVDSDWLSPIEDTDGVTDQMLETPVEAVTFDGDLYGIPLYTDANVFYYRSDKLDEHGFEPPETYLDVVEQAQTILASDDEITKGYIWQGGPNEGLTIMWLNWLWGMGGTVRENGELVVNSQKGVDALGHAVDLIHEYEITPDGIPASGTEGNLNTFKNGNTLFMRNWPFAAGELEEADEFTGEFGVTTMPKAEGYEDTNNSCLGGWSILVNSFSDDSDAAEQFANYVGSLEVQETLALEFSRLPVREELYTDEYFEQEPRLETFAQALKETSARPGTPQYGQFSEIVWTHCNAALFQDKTPQEALDDAQAEIDDKIN